MFTRTKLLAGVLAFAIAAALAGVSVGAATAASSTFDKSKHSITKASSKWVVVNKRHSLSPRDWAPSDLVTAKVAHVNSPRMRKEAAAALTTMFSDSAKKGHGAMQVQSAYRSYSSQVSVYNGWVKSLGKKQADRQSARPGFSEHQTGLAVDISTLPSKCALAACFADTKQGKWLHDNSWKYGFILRYPKNAEKITGYEYEPWHFRYVGVSLATEMHNQGIHTLEKFFGLKSAPKYK